MTKQLCVLTLGICLGLATFAPAQSLLDGTSFQASIYNMPESIGTVRLVDTTESNCRATGGPLGNDVAPVEACLVFDSGIDPVSMTFNAGPQDIGNLVIEATAEPFAGVDPIEVFNAATNQSVPLASWSTEGDLLEFTLRTKNDTYPATDEEDFWGFSATGIQYPNAAPDSHIGLPFDEVLGNYTNFYFWFEDKDGPIEEYDIFLEVGIGAGKHPTEDRDAVFILYSRGQTDEQTDTPPGGSMDFHSHGSILHENPLIGNLFFLADGVGVDALAITGIGLGFLIEPPAIAMSGLPGDFDNDNELTANDIDLLSAQVGQGDLSFDLNNDGAVTNDDRLTWVHDLAGTILGDTNLDRMVDFADFLALSTAFNGPGGWAKGDADGSGNIEFADFLALSTNFGITVGEPVVVPEPTSWTMLLTLAIGGMLVRRRPRAQTE